ncbi:retron system putative HNH endonuclease [Phormidium sp. CCY1219]|uniref:retron system putative HNH endonuclease n=1 Tax=Phormidium sp. CCY1219 TaxID=2886104 RepID=UPI002D1EB41B|nr:retron system putative HNH endonuclease [Phormidium sp. CCY1219]MEB3826285.1 TIGR02646 family protein [Phormidium sp. CCY1219]
MKYIKKGNEPEEFTQWKEAQRESGVNCDYKSLQNPQKGLLHAALLSEQGYICCYCCQRVDSTTSYLEHLEPQSETDPDLALDYTNLLASCGRDPNWLNRCGKKKGNRHISVSPLMVNCEAFFRYSGDGEMLPTEESEKTEAVATTIDIFGLNDYDLRQARMEAIDIWIGITETEAQLVDRDFQQRDDDGKYQPFCPAVLYYLQEYYGV